MATAPKKDAAIGPPPVAGEIAGYLRIPADRRNLAAAHAATLSQTAARVALELPLGADVDDFRRVLATRAER